MVASELERINSKISSIFGLIITQTKNRFSIINNTVEGSIKSRSRTQSFTISCLSLAILSLFLIIDGVQTLSHCCQHSKQKMGCNMASAASFQNGTESATTEGLEQENYEWNLCLTSGCVTSANSVLQNMDREVDPCDNFYEFACGKFLKEAKIPDDRSAVTAFSAIGDELEEQIREILDEPILPNDIKPFVYAKTLFNTCMNKSKIGEKGATPLLCLLKELGGWPVLEGSKWNEADWDWKKSVYSNRKKGLGINYFLSCYVRPDMKNSTSQLITVGTPLITFGQDFLIGSTGTTNFNFGGDKVAAALFNYMVKAAVLLGADKKFAESELIQSLHFESKLAEIFPEKRDMNKKYNPMTLPQFQQKFPSIPWKDFLQNILTENMKLKPDEKILVSAPTFLTRLEGLLKDTPKRIQANYALWRVVSASVRYLSDKFRSIQLEYATVVTGRTEMSARWKKCVSVTSDSLPIAVGAQYVRKFFKEDSKEIAEELVCRIRKEMYKILESVDWMDEKTRSAAEAKARAMATHIAYPVELLDDKKLIQYYEKLDISSDDDFIGAILKITKSKTDIRFSRLRDPVNKTNWVTHGTPAVVNAYYNPIENSIQFPAGILQGVFFNKDRPHYMNYGAIGFVIGHEITHGFDTRGSLFDKDGNLVEWWDKDSRKKYLKKVKCIIDQYSNYTVRQVNMKVMGVNTQGENIADNGGVKESYYAYKAWEKQFGPEPRLPGLQMYTPHQMFWISAANVWCGKFKNAALAKRIVSGVHSPSEFRVVGSLSNRKEFAKDFGCPIGSKMNPKHKCSVW